jgi:hypothetical protein
MEKFAGGEAVTHLIFRKMKQGRAFDPTLFLFSKYLPETF